MTALNNILPSDVRTLKRRIHPSVLLVDALVARTASLDAELREGWQRFASSWRDYFAHEGWEWPPIPPSRFAYERGEELERELRSWKSVLSSHCPGVPAPCTRRPAPFLGTWATPSETSAQKKQTDAAMRELNELVGRCGRVDGAFLSAWGELFRAWVDFSTESDSWLHGAAQFECAVAYEDGLAEWREAFGFACAAPAPASPPAAGAPSSSSASVDGVSAPDGRTVGLALGALGLVVVLAVAKGARG